MDSDRVIQVGQLLQSIAHQQNKSVVTVTHDIRLKEFADHIYELVDGELTQVK
ncbi:ABC-type enterochelin transport system, ATPase component [Weissella viridescens]|uniref:ABC-type enterochelin transport system, ATPase component n=1 Tax=Weissella viridescens TaxID=1629 RepID=A0A380P1S4_WEIVI|nr:ABC-type enterochelin transport system, ATPase component [Weissella viridescens]